MHMTPLLTPSFPTHFLPNRHHYYVIYPLPHTIRITSLDTAPGHLVSSIISPLMHLAILGPFHPPSP